MPIAPTSSWLDQYGNADALAWQVSRCEDDSVKIHRPLGLIEYAFDSDGRYFEGRADLNVELDLTMKTSLNKEELRNRILLAWTLFRCEHPLASSKAVERQSYMPERMTTTQPIHAVVDVPKDEGAAIASAQDSLVFLEDHYDDVDPHDFWLHAQNTGRVVDSSKGLSKCFVYPLLRHKDGTNTLRFLLVLGHQIADGLTNYTWMRSFVHLLNKSLQDLHASLQTDIKPEALLSRLPPPQEALYPHITGSLARQRWFWVLTRILRHVRKPHPAGFSNPLRRAAPVKPASLPHTYSSVLDYTRLPVLNTIPVFAKASLPATTRLNRICRSARVSVGAGCFAVAALLMMEFYERQDPSIPLSARKPFITGFPLNPRPFLSTPVAAESLMLAFSDGIELPFLPSYLPLENRIKLLAKRAQKQLAVYQKRERPVADKEGLHYMGSRGPGRMLATQYLASLERADAKMPFELQRGGKGPQGDYPMRPNATVQTCGVSSVGRRDALIQQRMYDAHAPLGEGRDFVADFKDMNAAVRARDGEFLIGVGGAEDGLWLCVSADASALDPVLMKEWQARLHGIFEEMEEMEKQDKASL